MTLTTIIKFDKAFVWNYSAAYSRVYVYIGGYKCEVSTGKDNHEENALPVLTFYGKVCNTLSEYIERSKAEIKLLTFTLTARLVVAVEALAFVGTRSIPTFRSHRARIGNIYAFIDVFARG